MGLTGGTFFEKVPRFLSKEVGVSPPKFVLLTRDDIDLEAEKASNERLKAWLREHTTGGGVPKIFFGAEALCLYEGLKDRGPWTESRLQHAYLELEALPIGGNPEIAQGREERIIEARRACESRRWLTEPLDAFLSTIPYADVSYRYLFVALAFVILLTAPVGVMDDEDQEAVARPAS